MTTFRKKKKINGSSLKIRTYLESVTELFKFIKVEIRFEFKLKFEFGRVVLKSCGEKLVA